MNRTDWKKYDYNGYSLDNYSRVIGWWTSAIGTAIRNGLVPAEQREQLTELIFINFKEGCELLVKYMKYNQPSPMIWTLAIIQYKQLVGEAFWPIYFKAQYKDCQRTGERDLKALQDILAEHYKSEAEKAIIDAEKARLKKIADAEQARLDKKEADRQVALKLAVEYQVRRTELAKARGVDLTKDSHWDDGTPIHLMPREAGHKALSHPGRKGGGVTQGRHVGKK